MSALLALESVAHSFGGLAVLNGVTLDVGSGEIVGLIGPNGSGKTTLFNVISGFIAPDHGCVRYDGVDITRGSVQARSRAGLVRTFQTASVFGNMTVLENIALGLYKVKRTGIVEGLAWSHRARREMVELYEEATATCETFGLAPLASRLAGSLAAGQQRLVEVLRAAISRPRLLLLDEPSTGLNQAEIRQLTGLVRSLHERGGAVLLVSHDMALAMSLSKRIYVLDFGKVIEAGTPDEVRKSQRVRDVYLGAAR